MKKAARILTAVLMAVLLLGSAPQTFADTDDTGADGETFTPYSYEVTVYAGRHGHFSGGAKSWTGTFEPGAGVSLDLESLGFEMDTDEYYPKGLRKTGHDNSTVLVQPSFTANEDVSYEVAYGIKGGMVSYTVQYVDADGNELLPSDTYYGMPGDKPVVSYKYIEGYQPTAYNETKTLTDREADNVFLFRYRAAAGTGNTAGNAGAQGAAGTTGTADNTGTAGADNAGGAEGAGAAAGENAQPAEIVDLDTEEVPLADNTDEEEAAEEEEEIEDSAAPLSGPAIAGIAIGSLGILGLIFYLLARKKAKEKAE